MHLSIISINRNNCLIVIPKSKLLHSNIKAKSYSVSKIPSSTNTFNKKYSIIFYHYQPPNHPLITKNTIKNHPINNILSIYLLIIYTHKIIINPNLLIRYNLNKFHKYLSFYLNNGLMIHKLVQCFVVHKSIFNLLKLMIMDT